MPTGLNNSQLNDFAPSWVSEPNGRGTWKVLYSCVFTLSLCVYTAIHLNVGPAGETTLKWWIHKSKWVLLAIVSPELVLYTAGKQWFSAGRLSKKLNQLTDEFGPELISMESEPFWSGSQTPQRATPLRSVSKPKYSMMYAHFVVMGGFVVDVGHLHNSLSRLTISPKGIAFLAKHGHFLNISDTTIRDKSKADILGKMLVCFQVTWMLVQTISRRILGFPITLLEIHTLVHVVNAIGLYGLWVQKPLDVRDPAWVDASGFQDLLALMLVRNYGFGNRVHLGAGQPHVGIQAVEYSYQNGSESSYLHAYPTEVEQDLVEKTTSKEAEIYPVVNSRPRQLQDRAKAASLRIVTHHVAEGVDFSLDPPSKAPIIRSLISGQALPCGIGPALSVRPIMSPGSGYAHDGRLSISLTEKDILRWNLAASALRDTGEALHKDTLKGFANYFTDHAPNIFLDRKGLQAGFYAYFCAWASGGLIAALVICVFYGGAHTVAWDFTFPTPTEHLLWKIACIDTIGGVISLLAIFSILVYLHEHDVKSLLSAVWAREPGIMPYVYRFVILVGVLNTPLFLLSRMFIIVEPFISLRHVPLGVYDTVNWSEYIPHL